MAEAKEQTAPKNAGLRSGIFFLVLVVVVGTFYYLSTLDAPPDMPANEIHKLDVNTTGDLVGLAGKPLPSVDLNGQALKMDKKSLEARVNIQCMQCHGLPPGVGLDDKDLSRERDAKEALGVVPACALTGRLCPSNIETHPPKGTCIKCHRMPGAKE